MKISRPTRIFLAIYLGLLAGFFVVFFLGKRTTRDVTGPQVEAWRELTDEELLALHASASVIIEQLIGLTASGE